MPRVRSASQTATDFQILDAMYPLPADELFRQWVLTRDAATIPESWSTRSRDGWHLGCHPDAFVADLRAADGTHLGWILEPLAHLEPGGGTSAGGTINVAVPAHPSPVELERALYGRDDQGRSTGNGIEGMWVAIVLAGLPQAPIRRVYLGAIHSVVYSVEQRTVAATHNPITGLHRDETLSRAFDPLASHAFFTFGLTAFQGLSRLLPNTCLDLDRFTPLRHWPRRAPSPLAHGEEGAAAVVEHGRALVRALSRDDAALSVFLSAGHDSRAILALLRPLTGRSSARVSLRTTVAPELESLVDLQAARRLARTAGLPHEVTWRRRHRAHPRAVMRAFARIGESKSGPILSSPDLTRPPRARADVSVAGMGGETARAYYWKKGQPSPRELTPELLVRRVGSPLIPRVVEAADAWLATLPEDIRARPVDVLDLAYVEQRLGCWESSTRYLFPGRPRVTSPMATAFSLDMMLRLPEPYRLAGVFQRDMVAYGWPELLDVPFNRPTGLLALLAAARAAASRARMRLRPLVHTLRLR